MKRVLKFAIIAGVILSSQTLFGQLTTSYFMPGSIFRSELNPALRPSRGYISLPAMGGTSVNYMSNSLTIDNLLYPKDGGLVTFLDESVSADSFLSSIQENNTLNVGANTKLLGIGTYIGRGFLTMDLSVKMDAHASLPRELFEFLKASKSGESYDLSSTALSLSATAEASLGYSMEVLRGLTVGVRAKYIGGLAHATMEFENLDMTLNANEWSINSRGVATLALNGARIPTNEDGVMDFGAITMDKFSGLSGGGAAIDLGASYDLGFARLSASVLNLGYMKWSASAIQRGVAVGNYKYSGFEIVDGENNNPLDGSSFNDFARFRPMEGVSEDFKSKLTSNVVLAAEVPLINDLLSVGAIYNYSMRELYNTSQFSLAATLTPTRWLTASASYSSFGKGNDTECFGVALNFHPAWINLFVGTDFMFREVTPQYIPVNQHNANVYVGLSVPLSRQKVR